MLWNFFDYMLIGFNGDGWNGLVFVLNVDIISGIGSLDGGFVVLLYIGMVELYN